MFYFIIFRLPFPSIDSRSGWLAGWVFLDRLISKSELYFFFFLVYLFPSLQREKEKKKSSFCCCCCLLARSFIQLESRSHSHFCFFFLPLKRVYIHWLTDCTRRRLLPGKRKEFLFSLFSGTSWKCKSPSKQRANLIGI